jgi:predicted dehydrogenase
VPAQPFKREVFNMKRNDTMKKLRIGVVGAGAARGQWWIGTIKRLADHLELTGICEPVKARHEENQKRWQAPIYGSLVEMIEADKPDAVLCAVPPDGNPAIAHVAARHGIHVVSEIPVAPMRHLAKAMESVAKDNGVKLEIAENVYRWPLERLKQKIVRAGHIGDIRMARLSYITGSYHGFNAIRFLMGCEARRVLGFAHDLVYPFHDSYMGRQLSSQRWGVGVIEFENGAYCAYEKPVMGGCGGQEWSVEGDRGNITPNALELGKTESPERLPYQSEYVQAGGREVLQRLWVDTEVPVAYENPYAKYGIGVREDHDEVARADILVNFHDAIINGKDVAYPPARAWGDQELVVAIEESHRKGNQWVNLPLDESCEVERALHQAFKEMYKCDPANIESLVGAPLPRGGVRCTVLGDM